MTSSSRYNRRPFYLGGTTGGGILLVTLFFLFVVAKICCSAFVLTTNHATMPPKITTTTTTRPKLMALGDFTVELEKPLGLILEERGDDAGEGGGGGVVVKELTSDGSAAISKTIVPGDVLLRVNQKDVSNMDFDSVMDLLRNAPSIIELEFGDGLGTMDMPKNVQKQLKSTEDLFFGRCRGTTSGTRDSTKW